METSAKDVYAVIRKSPSLMITGGVVLFLLLYYFYEKNRTGAAATTATPGAPTPTPFGGTYTYNETVNQPAPVTLSAPTLPGAPPPVTVITTQPPKMPAPSTALHTFLGSTGVKHVTVPLGNTMTLSQLAATYIPGGNWNSIYAIPANQKAIGKKNAAQLRTYVPKPGTVLTLPPNAQI